MLKQALAAFALLALAGASTPASGKKTSPPPGQPAPDDRDEDERRARAPAAAQPMYAPPAYVLPAPPTGRYTVLTEAQKRCGVQRGCELDSRSRCPPCW